LGLGARYTSLTILLTQVLALGISPAVSADPHLVDRDSHYIVDGLTHPAEIIVDEWGVPHIYANDHYDVFFVQGFNAARDRLWQIDLWRKRGLGELAAVLGADYVAQDRATRLFLYRGDMYSEWLAYGNDAKRITEAFTAGINAYVRLTQQQPDLLPPEFELLGYKPATWQAEDVVRIRSNGLWRNVSTEVWRAQLACADQLSLAEQLRKLEPQWKTQIPEGLDPCDIPQEVLDTYTLAKAPVDFNQAREEIALQDTPEIAPSLGSNNWVVAPQHSATGRPILADDPHRGHATPSLRYIAHLHGPGINVIGAGEPALPGISIGHNERIAFGLTIFPIDQEDLYVYDKAPIVSDPDTQAAAERSGYRYQDGVEPFVKITERIEVANAAPVDVTLTFTRHGPVVGESDDAAYAVRAAWLEPGMSPYFGSIEYMRAQNFREFIGALNRWGAPSENQVYADVDGNIGYKPAGRFPIRRNWDGLMPVPGDGRYEWDGYFDMDVLPEEYNPERGYSGTANSMNLPEGYPIDDYRIGFEWSAPWRYKRLWGSIAKDLASGGKHTLQDSIDLQRDYTSVLARHIIQRLPQLKQSKSGRLLATWDFELARDSAAAALYNVWYHRHLVVALKGHLVDQHKAQRLEDTLAATPLDSQTLLALLETKAGARVAYSSLETAWNETLSLLGDDPSQWQWGELHQIRFEHPLRHLADTTLLEQMSMPAYPRGGSANTTNNTGFRAEDFLVRGGASFRMVVDVGNWDAARATNAPGQSGDPRSQFYDNLLDNWATEDHFPLLYSRTAVKKHAAFSIKLDPRRE